MNLDSATGRVNARLMGIFRCQIHRAGSIPRFCLFYQTPFGSLTCSSSQATTPLRERVNIRTSGIARFHDHYHNLELAASQLPFDLQCIRVFPIAHWHSRNKAVISGLFVAMRIPCWKQWRFRTSSSVPTWFSWFLAWRAGQTISEKGTVAKIFRRCSEFYTEHGSEVFCQAHIVRRHLEIEHQKDLARATLHRLRGW